MRQLVALGALIRKEFRQTLRDRRMVALITFVPAIQLLVFGYAVNLDVEHLPTVICDADGTLASRDLAGAFTAGEAFDEVARLRDPAEASRLLETGAAGVVLVLPRGLEADLAARRPARVQILIDGSNPNTAQIGGSAAYEIVALRARELLEEALEARAAAVGLRGGELRVEPRVLFNPALRSRIFMVPGVAATLLLIVTTITTAVGIAREREVGTLEQVMVTPMSRATFILGKTIPYALLGYLDVLLVLAAGIIVFDVPAQGSLTLLALATGLYLSATLGMGLLISNLSATMQQAFLGAFLFILPAILLSGFFTPVANMPSWLQPVAMVNPVRYFVEILRGSLLRDARWSDLAPQLTALAAFGGGILILAVARFRKRLR